MTDFIQKAPLEQPPAQIAQNLFEQHMQSLYRNSPIERTSMTNAASEISTGQIQSMVVPADWKLRTDFSVPASAGLTEYNPPGHDTVRLKSFYRGRRESEQAGHVFQDCLAKPSHNLSAAEIKDLAPILRDKAKDFDIFFARTIDLNGKRVLSIEGAYKNDPSHTSAKTLYVDADGTGRAVQEISFVASGHDYQNYLRDAEKAFRSIVWK